MKTLLATILTFAMATVAWAGIPKVSDQAGFFSPDAVSKADQRVQDIKRATGKDVVIETFPTIPDDQKARYSDATKNEFFVNWARSNARAEKDNGLYVLICREPAHLQVEVGNQTQKQAFTLSDRDRLRDILVAAFRDKNYDSGLSGALDYVDQTFKANGVTAAKNVQDNAAPAAYPQRNTPAAPSYPSAPSQTRSTGAHFGWLWILILVFGAFFIIRMIMRRATGSYRNYGNYGNPNYTGNTPPPIPGAGYGPNYGGGGGGGFGRGLLGGLLGGAAGSYIYDRMARPHDTRGGYTTPPPADQGGGGTWGGGSPADTSDFAGPSSDMGGGGDFGGDSGGSSFDSGGGGGFDSGGGGGGDSGGGGGGGGDF